MLQTRIRAFKGTITKIECQLFWTWQDLRISLTWKNGQSVLTLLFTTATAVPPVQTFSRITFTK